MYNRAWNLLHDCQYLILRRVKLCIRKIASCQAKAGGGSTVEQKKDDPISIKRLDIDESEAGIRKANVSAEKIAINMLTSLQTNMS